MRLSIMLCALAACGSPTGVLPDGGDGDAAAGSDGGSNDGGSDGSVPVDTALVDPALCPIGPADGCCPLLRYGGRDPDCPSLSCEHLVATDPILLEEQQPNESWRGATGLAWTGKELVLARSENLGGLQTGQDLIVERRAPDGTLASGPHFVRRSQNFAYTAGHTSLAYDETSKTILFVDSTAQAFRATKASLDGAIEWERRAYTICNGIDGIANALVRDGTLMVAGEYYTCAGSTGQPALAQFAQDGTAQPIKMFGDSQYSWEAGIACGFECDKMFVSWNGSSALRAQMFDLATQVATPATELGGPYQAYIDHQGVASDGTRFFHYSALGLDAAGNTQRRFRLYDPTAGWVDAGVTITGIRGLPPSVIWTGDGWMVAVASFLYSTSYAFPTDHSAYHVELYHFAPDGTLREQWQNEAMAGYHPQLAWAGGRIAMTWVRATGTSNEERYLRYFDCP
jgi:hypothetical protein